MKLYEFARAPNPRRVRIFLAEKGINVPAKRLRAYGKSRATTLNETLDAATRSLVRFLEKTQHCRVAKLAALGFIVAEGFHPLFGGTIDAPSYVAFQATPLQTFWPVTVLLVGTIEIFGIFAFESPFDGKWWTLKSEHTPGDYSFDPAGLKPTGAIELKDMQTKELNNGRLAMIAAAGMLWQELATGHKLF